MLEPPVSSAAGSEVVVLEELVDEALELVELATMVCITLSEKQLLVTLLACGTCILALRTCGDLCIFEKENWR